MSHTIFGSLNNPVRSISLVLLGHLSQRLMGELIVYQSLRRPNSNFIWRLFRMGEPKFVQMVLVT